MRRRITSSAVVSQQRCPCNKKGKKATVVFTAQFMIRIENTKYSVILCRLG